MKQSLNFIPFIFIFRFFFQRSFLQVVRSPLGFFCGKSFFFVGVTLNSLGIIIHPQKNIQERRMQHGCILSHSNLQVVLVVLMVSILQHPKPTKKAARQCRPQARQEGQPVGDDQPKSQGVRDDGTPHRQRDEQRR